ncbi:hypothetical protein BCV00_06815 [Vibrio breoganii]|nr:hypothetical protein BCV00_06815 [Vibrio breoganii]
MASYSASAETVPLYNVEMVTVSTDLGNESYGSAIDETGDKFAGDTLNGTVGIPFRDEAPFGIDLTFSYQDWDDIESYCYRYLGYNSCENWANRQWLGINSAGGLEREREAFYWGYTANANGFVNVSDGTTQLMDSPTSDYVPGSGQNGPIVGSNNVIVNKFTADGEVIGTTSSGYYDLGGNYGLAYRERGFVGDEILLPGETLEGNPVSSIVTQMGRTMAFDSFKYDDGTGQKTYIVGSASVAPFDYEDSDKDYNGRDVGRCFEGGEAIADPASKEYCQNFGFSTKAFIWEPIDSNIGRSVTTWFNTKNDDAETGLRDDRSYMASVRGAVVPNFSFIPNQDEPLTPSEYEGFPVLVGYNTYRDDNFLSMQAAIFYPVDKTSFDISQPDQWETKFISGAEAKDGDDYVYINTRATDINNNLLVIGESKRNTNYAENGAYPNKLFVANANDETPKAIYLNNTNESIFFNGAGGEAKAVNNYNEIVGAIDAESAREVNGKQRRRRGFIDPYDFDVGTHAARRALFQDRSWWLDDLTNDGNASGKNNQFRIISASDINDTGEIAATALHCASGYDNTGHNAYCGDGSGVEEVVAVKLVPNVDLNTATTEDFMITPRSVEQESVERQGGSMAPWMLGLLGLIGLRRRLKK